MNVPSDISRIIRIKVTLLDTERTREICQHLVEYLYGERNRLIKAKEPELNECGNMFSRRIGMWGDGTYPEVFTLVALKRTCKHLRIFVADNAIRFIEAD